MRSIPRSAPLQALVVIVTAILPYLAAPRNGFVFDDRELILSNPLVQEPGRAAEILTSHYWHPMRARGYLYRPLTLLSLRADRLLGGGAAAWFHAVNLVLHAAVCGAVLLCLRRFWGEGPGPLLGAILFAVHPIHSEAVAGIAGRADLLATLFVLIAWRLHMDGRPVWAALCFAAGLAAKESAVALPAILILSDLLGRDRPRGSGLLRRYLPLGITLGLYFAARWAVLGTPGGGDLSLIHRMDNPLAAVSWPVRVATAIKVLAIEAGLMALPVRLSADYSYDQIGLVTSAVDPGFLAGAGLLVAAVAAAWIFRGRRAGPTLPIALTLLPLAPVSNVAIPIGTILAERILYLPSLGICAGAGMALAMGVARGGAVRAAAWAAAALLALGGGARTAARVPEWKDNLSLFASAARTSPRSVKVQYNLGIELLDAGDAAAALPPLERAVEIGRGIEGRGEMMRDLATALSRLGREEEALGWLERARALEPDHAGILVNLGNAYLARGRPDRALEAYDAALQRQPGHAGARMNRASLLLRLGRAAEAVSELERVTREAPLAADPWYALADAYERTGRRADAARCLTRFLELAGAESSERIRAARSRLAELSR